MNEPRVLILEDSPSAMMDLVAKLLRYLPANHLFEAFDYESAVQIISNKDIDLAFVDLSMPDKYNGIDFIVDFLKINAREIPIVIVTSAERDSLMAKSLEAYTPYFLSKPVSDSQLQQVLTKLLNLSIQTSN